MTVVARVTPEHVDAFAVLAEEMDRFYRTIEFDPPDVRRQQVNDALFGDPPAAYALMAWNDGKAVGFASYSFLWPAVGLTRSLFLKELYVIESARRIGVGKEIMRTLAETAIKHDCSRLEWQTDQPNTAARRFYAELGIAVDDTKLCYRAQGEDLRALASRR